jgi:asparagine synthase (glutamine-hydrolysing)
MCGISGLINTAGLYSSQTMESIVCDMAEKMLHRGPDDEGLFVSDDAYCALAHRRLSIIDTSINGRQPMQSTDGKSVICFNGELYNYKDLRRELAGCEFRTQTDTEVLLQKLVRGRHNSLPELDGMFALAFFDKQTHELLLARDPFGEKPLYYIHNNEIFAFASELSALSVVPGFDNTVEQDAIAQYLLFQYVHSPATIYRQVKKLPPGYYLRLTRDGRLECKPYFRFSPNSEKYENRKIDDLADELEDILTRSIERRLMSDVPLGLFLSSGVDSSTIAALCTKKLGLNIKSFTIGFPGSPTSEHLKAREIAQHLGTNHQERMVESDLISLGSSIAARLDEPNGDTSCLPTFMLAEFAKEQVTVALSGDGGDELFGGYGKYLSVINDAARYGKLPWPINWDAAAAFNDHTFVLDRYSVTKLSGQLAPSVEAILAALNSDFAKQHIPLIDKMRKSDVEMFLPGAVLAKTDRMSMQHSLEVRSPFLNVEIARFAEKLSPRDIYDNHQGKLVLKHVARRYLPADWISRPKQGFDLPRQLFKEGQLQEETRSLLLESGSVLKEALGETNLREFFESQNNLKRYYGLWAMFILESWLRTHSTRVETVLTPSSPLNEVRNFLNRAKRKIQRVCLR